MKIRTIKQGQTLKLLDPIDNIAEGEEIVVEITMPYIHPLAHLSLEEKQNRIQQVLGTWQDEPEIDTIFAEINRNRHNYRGRQIDSFDE